MCPWRPPLVVSAANEGQQFAFVSVSITDSRRLVGGRRGGEKQAGQTEIWSILAGLVPRRRDGDTQPSQTTNLAGSLAGIAGSMALERSGLDRTWS